MTSSASGKDVSFPGSPEPPSSQAFKGEAGGLPSAGSTLTFFVLAFVLTIPFWVLGAVTGLQLLPGLPVAALSFVCPGLAALILVYRENGAAGAKMLVRRAFDYRRTKAKGWYAAALLLMPAVMALSFGVQRLTGTPVPAPRFTLGSVLFLVVAFFIGAVGEELGWSGYAIDPMQRRWGVLSASLVLGAIWAVYHYIALAQAHRPVAWIVWWSLWTVALRVIIVWLYNNTGRSVFVAALTHMTANLTWQLYPVSGSYWDPRVTGLILALTVLLIVAVWGLRTPASLQRA